LRSQIAQLQEQLVQNENEYKEWQRKLSIKNDANEHKGVSALTEQFQIDKDQILKQLEDAMAELDRWKHSCKILEDTLSARTAERGQIIAKLRSLEQESDDVQALLCDHIQQLKMNNSELQSNLDRALKTLER
jgi:hypothetical protein